MAHQVGSYRDFCSMKRLGVFLLFPRWDASPSQGCLQHYKFASTRLYTWVKRGTVPPEKSLSHRKPTSEQRKVFQQVLINFQVLRIVY